MPYLISIALLVALVAWMVGVYNNLEHLREIVCNCWGQWCRVTHFRNECAADFTTAFAAFLPPEDALPRDLRRLTKDSERSLALAMEPRWNEEHGFMGRAEQLLRSSLGRAVQMVEDSPAMREHEPLRLLCSNMAVSLYQQEQVAAMFNHAAREYNAALAVPSARLLAPVFGFRRADTLEDSSH